MLKFSLLTVLAALAVIVSLNIVNDILHQNEPGAFSDVDASYHAFLSQKTRMLENTLTTTATANSNFVFDSKCILNTFERWQLQELP